MSKKKFKQALDLVRAGDVQTALSILHTIDDRGFINKRLAHYKKQPDQREPAILLESALNNQNVDERREVSVRPTFSAPLPPATASLPLLKAITFDDPEPFLLWACADWDKVPILDLDQLSYTDVWALVALAALRLPERERCPPVRHARKGPAARFAQAVGLDAITGGVPASVIERERSVQLTRVRTREEIEPVADNIARLLLPGEESHAARLTIRYVLIELLRNVVQHSGDSLGGVVAAQRMGPAQRRDRPMVQLAVADAGIGIPRTLQRQHPHLVDYRQALERALLPHISGTFPEGLTGSFENAGLGLFVISEMARRTTGRLLLATTGAALVLQSGKPGHAATPRFLQPHGIGYPGTLAAFELPTDAVQDYRALINTILQTAVERTPKRATSNWLVYKPASGDSHRVAVFAAKEDTVMAQQLSLTDIRPALVRGQSVELDFTGLELCTQSWLHALLYEPVRLAWALRVPIHVLGADPAVREGLRFLEAYALGG